MRTFVKNCLIYSFFLLFILGVSPAHALNIKGFAHITFQKGQKKFNIDQAIILGDNGYHYFEVIDDFGNSLWSIRGNLSQKTLKKMGINIPLDIFLDLLKYDLSNPSIETSQDSLQRIISANPVHQKKKWQANYDHFGKIKKHHFPWLIKIKSNKTQLTIQWIHLSLI
ncbi:MAG: hypothetical protein ACD_73C00804G0001 [uncultured bacterium]|nr:MAG: hypothetical protein ACD_73C00804G0001 [uncultured bacterium]